MARTGGGRREDRPGGDAALPSRASAPAGAKAVPWRRRQPGTAGETTPSPSPSPVPATAPAASARLGYAHVNTDDQNLDLQRGVLAQAGCQQIYEEKASGKGADRPELDHVLADLRPGDTVVVWRLDRLGRNLADLVHIVSEVRNKGVGFESLTERIDTVTATGELVFHLFASLAQFERNLIRERTRAGLASARARGRKGGRPPKLGPKELREIKVLLRNPGVRVKHYRVSRVTLYAHLNATAKGSA